MNAKHMRLVLPMLGGALLALPAAAQYDTGFQVFNVKASYNSLPGALGNDTGDDGPAIQRALNAAATAKGGIVFVPAGRYRLASGITIPEGVTLEGSGWNRNPGNPVGSWLHVVATNFVPVTMTGDGPGLRGLAFLHDQPVPGPGWAPLAYPYAIEIVGNSTEAHVRDVLLLNPTNGLRQRVNPGEAAGRIYIDRLWGQPLQRGIEINRVADVMYVTNVHFGPIWSIDQNVFNYTLGNGWGIVSYYNDHPNFENIFLFYYQLGLVFGKNAHGVTTRFRVSNYECDLCWEGLRVWGKGVTGKVSNLDVHSTGANSSGVHVLDDDVLLTLDNVHLAASGAASIVVERAVPNTGAAPVVMIDNAVFQLWGLAPVGWAAVAASPGTEVRLGFNRKFIKATPSAPETSGPVALDQ
jgi:hypothetical protein